MATLGPCQWEAAVARCRRRGYQHRRKLPEMDVRAPVVDETGVRCWRCLKKWLVRVSVGTMWECPKCGAGNEA